MGNMHCEEIFKESIKDFLEKEMIPSFSSLCYLALTVAGHFLWMPWSNHSSPPFFRGGNDCLKLSSDLLHERTRVI